METDLGSSNNWKEYASNSQTESFKIKLLHILKVLDPEQLDVVITARCQQFAKQFRVMPFESRLREFETVFLFRIMEAVTVFCMSLSKITVRKLPFHYHNQKIIMIIKTQTALGRCGWLGVLSRMTFMSFILPGKSSPYKKGFAARWVSLSIHSTAGAGVHKTDDEFWRRSLQIHLISLCWWKRVVSYSQLHSPLMWVFNQVLNIRFSDADICISVCRRCRYLHDYADVCIGMQISASRPSDADICIIMQILQSLPGSLSAIIPCRGTSP